MIREPIIMEIDFNLHPLPFHIKQVDSIYLFSQAHVNDQGTLRDFCKSAANRLEQYRKEALEQSTGMVTSATPEQAAAEAERVRRARRG